VNREITGAELARVTDPRAAAELYVEQLGWQVVPTAGIVAGHCGCLLGAACYKHRGKHPLNPGGTSRPGTDRRTVRYWWNQWPWAGVGAVTGQRSGLFIVDVDVKDGAPGPATIDRLKADGVDLTATLAATTGSGGRHYLFALPEGLSLPSTQGQIPGIGDTPGVDLRGEGTMAVLPPSPHLSGRRYGFDPATGPLALPPAALITAVEGHRADAEAAKTAARQHRGPRAPGPALGPGEITTYAQAALAGELRRVQDSPADGHNSALFQAARRLGQLVAGGQLPRPLVERELHGAALTVGQHDDEARRTIASGLKHGEKEPRYPTRSNTDVVRRPPTRPRARRDPPGPPPPAHSEPDREPSR
jgi:hypothetical protein